ncbi:MAG TPA: pyrroloquinoline quinone biosynthesis protein PqqE [Verrucomicrobiae bacterium]|jgi:pyrroloquinoline quinone biosynthesis protein E|nr:pyrroloquinoline quinone biosynthesis protein PqqE [Verrucomicrobiae bacterium]
MSYRPYLLLAELTYGCPLHCPYCSNPTDYPSGRELTTAEWKRVFEEAAKLGVLHVGLSGGEPLRRADLADLVAAANAAGLYTNLITSAVGLQKERASRLRKAGLDSVQISFQADEQPLADRIAGTSAHAIKLQAAKTVRELGFPLTVNVVLHRGNIDRLAQIISLAERLEAERLELANTQYYGWAFQNRATLLPTRDQIARATEVVAAHKKRLRGQMEILFVTPDYYSDRPKPCMNGWGTRYLTVNPVGDVLPCPTATAIKDMRFDNVREHSLSWIWNESAAFNRFRGTAWMSEPCSSCPMREIDFGGCRCQAALIAGDPNATDPACGLSPYREKLTSFVESIQSASKSQAFEGERSQFVYRQSPGQKAKCE